MTTLRFIATRHPEYAAGFPGDTVIDPWRYVRGARGIGANKPDLISILVPSRGRPSEFARMYESCLETATYERSVEVVAYVDDDDPEWPRYPNSYPFLEEGRERVEEKHRLRYLRGQRLLLSEAWNKCFEAARGDIVMHCGDDIVFETEGWDVVVRDAFDSYPDKIVLVHGDDCSPNTDALATHGFLHRKWVEAVGYFLPPLFSSDWNDVWLTEVADMIGRRVKVPIVTEHMHYYFGKAEVDQTTIEREERGRRDDVVGIYKKTEKDRANDAAKLRAVMT